MANYYETLLIPTNVDNELLQQRYHQIRDSEGKWPVYPYYPLDLDYFLLAYQTLCNPVTRAAYDQEHNIVPQEASYKTCLQWTRELANENAGRGRTPGLYFAHIGIANFLNGGQIDFINGFAIRRNRAKRRVLITPDGDLGKAKPPYRITLPDCIVDIDDQQTVTVRPIRKKDDVPSWSYKWNPRTKKWFEWPVFPSQSDQATPTTRTKPKSKPKAKAKPKAKRKAKPKPRSRPDNLPLEFEIRDEDMVAAMHCPVCTAQLNAFVDKCPQCDTHLRMCLRCFRRNEYDLKSCPNCGHRP